MKSKFQIIIVLFVSIMVITLDNGGAVKVNDPFREECLSLDKTCPPHAACVPDEFDKWKYDCKCASGWIGDGNIGCEPPEVYLSISPDMDCDQSTLNTCFMTSQVGSVVRMSVQPHGRIKSDVPWDITWYKFYAGLPPLYHSFKEKLQRPESLSGRMLIDMTHSKLSLYEILENDIYPNRFIAEITHTGSSTPAAYADEEITPYDISQEEQMNPTVMRVYFMIEQEPIEIDVSKLTSPQYIDLYDMAPSITQDDRHLPHYRWASEGDFETLGRRDHILDDESDMSLSLHHLDDEQLKGVVRGMAFGKNDRVPGRVLLASLRFRLKEDKSKVCTGPLSERICTCRIGYTLNGTQCVDVDECISSDPSCVEDAECVNSDGSFHCQCPQGYYGDGETFCSDIDECIAGDRCHPDAICQNTPGSFVCKCGEGYVGDGVDCSVVSTWSEWSPWAECDVTCGERSTHMRTRDCTHPESGMICFGAPSEVEECIGNPPCPVHGGWSEWSVWSSCTSSCDGRRQRVRMCDHPTPQFGGLFCDGDMYSIDMCGDLSCPVPGDWGSWDEWSECSQACDGTQSRYRRCEPRQSYGRPDDVEGLCQTGNEKESRTCSLEDDPAYCNHGNVMKVVTSPEWSRWSMWNEWTHWSYCSTTCGEGRRYRRRTCKAATSHGGRMGDLQQCEGNHRETQPCSERSCVGVYRNKGQRVRW